MEKLNKVLVIDVDDCMCNTIEMDFACACVYKNIKDCENYDSSYFDIVKTFNLTKEEGDYFYTTEKKYIMKNTSMYPKIFVREVLHNLRKKGFTIIIASSRENRFWDNNAYKYTKKWLKKYKIDYDMLFVNQLSKLEVCKKYNADYIIEDNPNFVKKVNENNVKSILIRTSYNKDYKNDLNIFADNWLDLYKRLGEIYNFTSDDIINFVM